MVLPDYLFNEWILLFKTGLGLRTGQRITSSLLLHSNLLLIKELNSTLIAYLSNLYLVMSCPINNLYNSLKVKPPLTAIPVFWFLAFGSYALPPHLNYFQTSSYSRIPIRPALCIPLLLTVLSLQDELPLNFLWMLMHPTNASLLALLNVGFPRTSQKA